VTSTEQTPDTRRESQDPTKPTNPTNQLPSNSPIHPTSSSSTREPSTLDGSTPRPWTDDVRTARPDGSTSTTIVVKRCCNGCQRPLGDVTDDEIDAAVDGLPLPDVRTECGCEPQTVPTIETEEHYNRATLDEIIDEAMTSGATGQSAGHAHSVFASSAAVLEEIGAVKAEIGRLEGDLTVAVHEATTARARAHALRSAVTQLAAELMTLARTWLADGSALEADQLLAVLAKRMPLGEAAADGSLVAAVVQATPEPDEAK
jgi:hypothetical protein